MVLIPSPPVFFGGFVSLTFVFVLLVAFQIKHFVCDYPLQGKYMLGKFKPGWDFAIPLLTHASVHGLTTAWIVAVIARRNDLLVPLVLLDVIVHFIMDRVKAGPKYLGRFKIEQPYFWWSLGLDQMVHHLTHYVIIYILLTR